MLGFFGWAFDISKWGFSNSVEIGFWGKSKPRSWVECFWKKILLWHFPSVLSFFTHNRLPSGTWIPTFLKSCLDGKMGRSVGLGNKRVKLGDFWLVQNRSGSVELTCKHFDFCPFLIVFYCYARKFVFFFFFFWKHWH